MEVVTVEALTEAGFKNPEATFTEVAIAGGFGAIAPLPNGMLDIVGMVDPKAKAAVAEILSKKTADKKDATPAKDAVKV